MRSRSEESPTRPRPPPSRRRDKQQLSCHSCRRRKLKCDRRQPCFTCTKHGAQSSCSYAGIASTANPSVNRVSPSETARQPSSTRHVDIIEATDSPARHSPSISGSGSGFREGFHWTSVLNGISEPGLMDHTSAKGELGEQNRQSSTPSLTREILLLHGCKHATREELLEALPPRNVSDRKVALYFETLEYSPVSTGWAWVSLAGMRSMSAHTLKAILHRGEFLNQYQRFWDDPSGITVSCIGLLFSVLCLATLFQSSSTRIATGNSETTCRDTDTAALVQNYREKIVQSLILAKYSRGGPFIVETMIHYFMIEHYLRRDPDPSSSLLLGNIIRVAMGMAYHRDARLFPNLSPFEGEIRRRVWAVIYQLDLAVSTQLGIPRAIRDAVVDTAEPRNLFDHDFDAKSITIPASRTEQELTPMLITISKLRLTSKFGKILDFATTASPKPHSDVMDLHHDLTEAFAALPEACKFKSMSESILDSPNLISQRIYTHMIYHKAQIVLHTSHLAGGGSYSRDTCVTAAMRLLEFQHLLDEESHAGGRLGTVKWTVTSVFIHEFLLATSILCYYITHCARGGSEEPVDARIVRDVLQRTETIWARSSTVSHEADKALKALRAALRGPANLECSSRTCGDEGGAASLMSPMSTPQGPHDFQMPFAPLYSMLDSQNLELEGMEEPDSLFTDMPNFGLTPWF